MNIPIWIQILELPLKYWGCLSKLLSQIGNPIKPDNATVNRDRIGYARYLVEMDINGCFPDQLTFKSEHRVLTHKDVIEPIHS